MKTVPSERILRALAPFALDLSRPIAGEDPGPDAERVVDAVGGDSPARIALLTGPSGSGKSRLLGAVEHRLRSAGLGRTVRVDRVRLDPRRAVAEHRPSLGLKDWLSTLAAAGLAEARLFATPAGRLSQGERARLMLAIAMTRSVVGGAWMLIDECCSTLDRETAAGVAATLRRWATRTGTRLVAASAHADLERLLGPDVVVRCEAGSPARFEPGPGVARAGRIRIVEGTAGDHARLSRLHYRPGRPASPCRVLRAEAPGGRLAGVLVVTYPTLNGSWREMIWPGRYTGLEKPRLARRLNRELRRISRVIVDPRDRGRGVARRLVRAYLDNPATPATEAVAAMGRLSPFGASAGMTAYPMPPRPADDRLADMLNAMEIEPWELLDPARVDCLRGSSLLERELTAWARAVRSSIPKPRRGWTDVFGLAPLAAARLCAPPVAYGHVHRTG